MRFLPPVLVFVAGLLAAWPVADNYFYADDFAHLFDLVSFGAWDFLLTPNAGHMYVVRNFMFYMTYLDFGMEPAGYFATVIATHVLNGLLLWWLLSKLLDAPLLAAAGAIAFAAAPAHLGTLGWYSVYGHVLATMWTLLALIVLVGPAGDARPLECGAALGVMGLMLLASQSFGTGAAVAIAFPAIAVLLRPDAFRRRGTALPLLALPALVLLSWWVMNAIPTRANPAGAESVVNMAKLAIDYRDVAWMVLHLVGIGVHSLVLGAAVPLTSYAGVVSIATVAVVVAAVVAAFVLGSARARRTMAAFLVGAMVCWGAVAGGRAALYAAFTADNLLQAFTGATRYQYLAMALLAGGLAIALRELTRRRTWDVRTGQAVFAAWVVVVLGAAALFPPRRDDFDSDRLRVASALQRLDRAIERSPFRIVCLPIQPAALALGFPGSLGLYVLFHPTDDVEGRRIYFETDDPKVLALRAESPRLNGLLLPKGECPPKPPPS